MTIIYFQYAAAALAFIAAIFWFLSARVKHPENITMGWGGSGGTAQKLGDALIKQSRLSMYAALFAGAASLCEALFLTFPASS